MSTFPIRLTLEERYDDQDDPFSSSILYSPFLPVTQLAYSKSWVLVPTFQPKTGRKSMPINTDIKTLAIGGYRQLYCFDSC